MISLKILSTWGYSHIVGITEIEVFDVRGEKVKLEVSNLKILNAGGNATLNAHWMLNGIYLTTDEWNMWTTAMDYKKALEI